MITMHHPARTDLFAPVMILGVALAIPALAREADPLASKLPDGEGKQLVIESCAGACHSSDRILNARKTPAEWQKTVQQMVSNGAQLFPEEVDVVTKYLSEHMANGEPANAKK